MSSQPGSNEFSDIVDFYANKSIFITGGTGFLGKVLIEKLLRSCSNLNKIYILIRVKRGQSPQDRLNKLVECKLFSHVAKTHPDFRSKLVAIPGDILLDKLGISEEDETLLINTVNVVFHSAATVKFSEALKAATQMNVVGTQKVVDLVRSMKHLDAFIHVSTAYSNCDKSHIEEKVYDPPADPEQLINTMKWLDDEIVNDMTPKLIKKYPNTYTFTKAVAESLVVQKAQNLPCAIVRPSIVCSTCAEPFAGWVDSLNGPTSIYIGIGKGVLRVMLIDVKTIADYIPVDILVNMMISTAWVTAKEFKQKNGVNNQIKVYNCTSGQIKPILWDNVIKNVNKYITLNPLENIFFAPFFITTTSPYVRYIRRLLEQYLPAITMDLLLRLIRKKPIMIDTQRKVKMVTDALEFFTTNEWVFKNDNVFALMEKLSATDKQLFNVDLRVINWNKFIEDNCLGAKEHILKENMLRMKECRQSVARKKLIQNSLWVMAAFFLAKLILLRTLSAKKVYLLLFQLAKTLTSKVHRLTPSN